MTQLQQLSDSWAILFSQYPMQFPFLTFGYFEANLEWKHGDLIEQKHHGHSLFWVMYTFPAHPGDSWMQGSIRDSATLSVPCDPLLHCHLITSDINWFSLSTFSLGAGLPQSSLKLPSAGGRLDSWQSTAYPVPKGNRTIKCLCIQNGFLCTLKGHLCTYERPWEWTAKPSSLRLKVDYYPDMQGSIWGT